MSLLLKISTRSTVSVILSPTGNIVTRGLSETDTDSVSVEERLMAKDMSSLRDTNSNLEEKLMDNG
nr:MAG TPA: hypothetical protein [Caudoviricetes sp.]